MKTRIVLGFIISILLVTSTVGSIKQGYSVSVNDSSTALAIGSNQTNGNLSSNLAEIMAQNSDGKLNVETVPYNTTNQVEKNGTISTDGVNFKFAYNRLSNGRAMDGDMFLVNEQTGGKALADKFRKSQPWANGIIPVLINSNIPNQNRILDAIKYVDSVTPITFTKVHINPNGQITDSHYLRFVKASPEQKTCSTNAGMLSPTDDIFTSPKKHFYSDSRYHGQPLIVYDGCDKAAIIHELGHTLGLWHEQKRCDSKNYISIDWNNIVEDAKAQYKGACSQSAPDLEPAISIGEYDYCSIMHYKQFSNNAIERQKAVFTIIQPNKVVGCTVSQIGFVQVYSQTDLSAIKKIYSFVQ